jgi:hypothetical protein
MSTNSVLGLADIHDVKDVDGSAAGCVDAQIAIKIGRYVARLLSGVRGPDDGMDR